MFTSKRILIALFTICFSMISLGLLSFFKEFKMQEDKTYTELWKKVEAFESKGLTKSALEEVKKIYTKAKSENNAPQLVKTVIYKHKYTTQTEEEGLEKGIEEIKAEIKKSEF